jgi:hypothetical protein
MDPYIGLDAHSSSCIVFLMNGASHRHHIPEKTM